MRISFKFLIIKLIRMIALLLGMALLIYVLAYYSPIDPVQAYLGSDSNATPEQVENLKQQWGLNEPMIKQFLSWLSSLLRGDFGTSRLYRQPVLDIISVAFKNSLILMLVSWSISGVIGYILGVIAAFRRDKFIDQFIRFYSYVLESVPSNIMGLILLIIFGVGLKIFPVGLSTPIGILSEEVTLLQRIHHFILPCLTLTFLGVASTTLHTRRQVIEVLNSEYVMFAKARGENKWEIFKYHIFKNSLSSAIILKFAGFSELFGGSALAENVFAYYGLGSVMTQAGLKGDLPLLLGAAVFSSMFVFVGNQIADFLSIILNPKMRNQIWKIKN